jgi:outer membrane protein OmpA-like peptidoglycan-associated protein
MTDSVLDFVRSYLNNSFVQDAASKLKESPEGVKKALSAAVPTIFAGIENKASQDSSFMSTVLGKAKSIFSDGSSLKNLPNVLTQVPTNTTAPASNFVKSIFGNEVHNFTEKIGAYAGVKQSSAHALLNASGVASLGSIGKDAVEKGSTLSEITNFFKQHRDSFLSAFPALGLGSLFSHVSYEPEHVANEVKSTYETEKKKGSGFLLPLILALVIIALIIWVLMKTCNKGPAVPPTTDTTTVAAPAPVPTTTSVAVAEGDTLRGVNLNGIEKLMVDFLNSPAYKTATNDSLKDHWFSFDNVTFKTGTATLDSSSYPQINNLIDILKHYPDAKIKIGGNTDRTGDSLQNVQLSQQRADVLRKQFAPVASQVTSAEGYGWQYAKYAAGDPDSLRAKDRSMTLRFAK